MTGAAAASPTTPPHTAPRSTKTTDRRVAIKLAIQFEEDFKTHLTESQARRAIADIDKAQSGRRLTSKRGGTA